MIDEKAPETKPLYHKVLGKREFTTEHANRILAMSDTENGGWSEEEIKQDEPGEAGQTAEVAKTENQDAVDSNAGKGNPQGGKAGTAKKAETSK